MNAQPSVLTSAYHYLQYRPRTRKEMSDYLLRKKEAKGWAEEVITVVLSRLEEENLINDTEFITWFVEQRSARKGKSQFALTQELLRHGVNKEDIDFYFLSHPLDDIENAYAVLSARWGRFSSLPQPKRTEKATRFLLQRGFLMGVVRQVLARMEETR